jgi:glycerol kinase
MDGKYILVNDVGTTGTRAVLFDRETNIVCEVYREIPQIFPKPGWTEQDPVALFETCVDVTRQVLEKAKAEPKDIAAMGIATQRATSMIWDAETGEPVYNAITWQDVRMSDTCESINHSPLFKALHVLGRGYQRIAPLSEGLRKNNVGKMLITAAHFTVTPAQSSAHARWVLDNVPGAKERAAAGKLLLGTVDTWLVWNYTARAVHATDYSNVSATGMYDPFGMQWSSLLLKPFKLPGDLVFPEIRDTAGDFGVTEVFGNPIPIKCVVADQQAALFGEACFEKGSVKCTNGTGTFIDMNTGDEPMASINRLTPLIAWQIDGKATYMMEGIISSAGSSIQWLRDNLQIIKEASDSERLALACDDCGGVYVVPAFTGLTAPYWDPFARGTVIGLTRATSKEQVVRATLESIAYQCKDVIEAMQKDTDIQVKQIKADGGASANDFLMQFLADILDVKVERPQMLEATALGAAFLAGIAAGIWKYPDDITRIRRVDRDFMPAMDAKARDSQYAGWKKAVGRASKWA